jgi:hypothetical protein
MDIPVQRAFSARKPRKMQRARPRVHIGEPVAYTPYGGSKKLLRMRPGVQKAIEGYRNGCTCHRTDLIAVPDREEYNMLRYPKAWIWGTDFAKTIYYM